MENDTILKLQKQISNLEKRLEQYYQLLLNKIGGTASSLSLNDNSTNSIKPQTILANQASKTCINNLNETVTRTTIEGQISIFSNESDN